MLGEAAGVAGSITAVRVGGPCPWLLWVGHMGPESTREWMPGKLLGELFVDYEKIGIEGRVGKDHIETKVYYNTISLRGAVSHIYSWWIFDGYFGCFKSTI